MLAGNVSNSKLGLLHKPWINIIYGRKIPETQQLLITLTVVLSLTFEKILTNDAAIISYKMFTCVPMSCPASGFNAAFGYHL